MALPQKEASLPQLWLNYFKAKRWQKIFFACFLLCTTIFLLMFVGSVGASVGRAPELWEMATLVLGLLLGAGMIMSLHRYTIALGTCIDLLSQITQEYQRLDMETLVARYRNLSHSWQRAIVLEQCPQLRDFLLKQAPAT